MTAAAVGHFAATGLFAFITYMPSVYQLVHRQTAGEAGLLMLPFTGSPPSWPDSLGSACRPVIA